MVNKACDVTLNVRIARVELVNTETPDLSTGEVFRLALRAVLISDLFTRVVNNPLVLIDALEREDTPPMKL